MIYGITQDPETHSYIIILKYAEDGNLREYLKINFNNINWKLKLLNLWDLSLKLMNIHCQDFHPGNILFSNFKKYKENPNNPSKKNIFDVLPHNAPEVMNDVEEYAKAADVQCVTNVIGKFY
ncbi:hypothetical protein Glove_230g32 [Diversispora epigaea]|uniref:Protein kinase domain-containing protein n=1 Tax=Diversispora epigaea TaxID=1348612 RepID=A0A397IHD7_9GLOM|nr:hypothetical protein Glove_230g32 [Diversispora epigaea]